MLLLTARGYSCISDGIRSHRGAFSLFLAGFATKLFASHSSLISLSSAAELGNKMKLGGSKLHISPCLDSQGSCSFNSLTLGNSSSNITPLQKMNKLKTPTG